MRFRSLAEERHGGVVYFVLAVDAGTTAPKVVTPWLVC